jgi:hypothetical protein
MCETIDHSEPLRERERERERERSKQSRGRTEVQAFQSEVVRNYSGIRWRRSKTA